MSDLVTKMSNLPPERVLAICGAIQLIDRDIKDAEAALEHDSIIAFGYGQRTHIERQNAEERVVRHRGYLLVVGINRADKFAELQMVWSELNRPDRCGMEHEWVKDEAATERAAGTRAADAPVEYVEVCGRCGKRRRSTGKVIGTVNKLDGSKRAIYKWTEEGA